ncbi:MAG: cysteine--tRNA ligase [Bacillota bacterium]
MKLYNTLTKTKEEFQSIDNQVKMYSCGPTVYNYAHIGNMRTYIFMDLLTRTLKYSGKKVKSVMNITDVGHLLSDADDGEDKMAIAAKRLQKSPYEIADYYTKVFFEDLAKLNIEKPNVTPKATDHIAEMINIVEVLQEKGIAYETSDGIYYDIEKFPGYGTLSNINLEEQIAGARVEVNTEKRHPADFAVWKHAPKEHIMQWQSPWGMGYPGWHIECTAMSHKYLGEVFDIHTGGVDHIPIHHENEIAQSYGFTGKNPANYWMHGEFMLVNGGKMSKKLGNTYTITQLSEMGYSPLEFRFFCLNAHYRKKLNFTFESLDAAKVSYKRMMETVAKHKASNEKTDAEVLAKFDADFTGAVMDDLNVPKALGVLFTMLKQKPSKDIFNLAVKFDKILGLSLDKAEIAKADTASDIPAEILALDAERIAAKKAKDYAKADEIRGKIKDAGYEVKDTREGSVFEKIN